MSNDTGANGAPTVQSGVDSLKKHNVSLFVLLCLMYSLTCGGPFGIEDMVSACGPGLAVLVLLIFPFFFSVPQGLIAAELGSAMPDEGGYYVWVRKAFGEFWGYQVGWWRSISCYVDSAVYIVLAVGYLGAFISLTGLQAYLIKVGFILFFTYINIRGIKDVGSFTTILTVFVVAVTILFVILGFANFNQNPFEPFAAGGNTFLGGLGLTVAIAIWLYSGYESMSTMAGELEKPQLITKAIIISLPLVVATYVLPIIAGMAVHGEWEKWSPDTGVNFVSIGYDFGIPGVVLLLTVAAMTCNLALYNSYLASGSRGFFVLADDNLLPKWFCRVDKKYGAPRIAILSMALVNLVLVQFDFAVLIIIDVFLFIMSYLVWFVAGIALRYKEPDMPRPFKIPGGNKFLILIFIAPIAICIASFFINGISYMLGGCVGILSGPATYVIFKKMYGGLNNEKKMIKKDKIAMWILVAVTAVVFCIGMFMYQQEKANANYDLDELYGTYYSQDFEMDDVYYSLGYDSFYTYFTLNDNEDISVEVWYYYGDMTGYVYLPEEFDDEGSFADAVYDVYSKLASTNEGLPLSYVEFEDDAGYYFYAEYGDIYRSAAEIMNAMEE